MTSQLSDSKQQQNNNNKTTSTVLDGGAKKYFSLVQNISSHTYSHFK